MTMLTLLIMSGGRKIEVKYDSSCKIRDFILDITLKFMGKATVSSEEYIVKFGDKLLNTEELLDKKLEEIELEDEDCITLLRKCSISAGGYGIDMADISNKSGLVQNYYSKNAAKWNEITKGLNVSGICQNQNCEAYNKEVDCKIGMKTINLVENADEIRCPMCNREIEPTTCTFCECEYRMEGKKKENGQTKYVRTYWKRVEKDYEYYEPSKSGIVRWLMLIIETRPL